MKKIISFFMLFSCLAGCKKENISDVPRGNSVNYSQPSNNVASSSVFSFTEIRYPGTIQPGKPARLEAICTGKNLRYEWLTSHGDLFGVGPVIYYSDSCTGTFSISCTVSDGTNKATHTVSITISI